ncbi:MAG: ATP synthase F1 subunit gamma, partial [Actinomycetota bacterium]|nr:ATP synthase F1 subunit gamma [Actinomycetota bacterium]
RRAEQRIEAVRPYADAIRKMTRQAAEAAGDVPRLPILAEHESENKVGLLVVAGDRGLAGAFNSNAVRAGVAAAREHAGEGREATLFASGRRAASSLTFRGFEPADSFTGFSERPAFADARSIAERLMAAYIDNEVDRVEIFYNGYVSPLTQEMRRETLLPLQKATVLGDDDGDGSEDSERDSSQPKALVEYEPEPEEILGRLVPDYVEISIYRALLESSASELGARMTAMRNASENASNLIEDYTLQMNRARQAEITQEIMEVVAGAEGLR